jgi:plastocyanin
MLRDVRPAALPRRTILSGLGGVGIAAVLAACGGGKASPTVDSAFATNAARNAASTVGSASTTGSATVGTPAAAGSQTASTASGSSVAATGSGVAGTTAAVTAPVATNGGGATPGAATGPTPTHITGVGTIPKPLPTQGGAPPTLVGVSAASPASGTPASVPSQILATAGVATASGSSVAGTAAPGASPAPAAQVAITADRTFNPPQVTVRTGQAIQWVNMGRAPQTVTGDPARAANKQDAILPANAQPWDSGVLNSGARYTHTFTTPGDYVYFSIPFEGQGMIGRITVTG